VVAATGDHGAALPVGHGKYVRTVQWPSSDPSVVAVGGTRLYLDADGETVHPPVVWDNSGGAGGGGLSQTFDRPAFQNPVSGIIAGHRGVPDMSMSAAAEGGLLIYQSFLP
jgi:kumamolisin